METKYSVLTVIAFTLVIFTILFLSLIVLKSLGKRALEMRRKYLNHKRKRLEDKAAKLTPVALVEETNEEPDRGEKAAAITMALHLYLNANRDEESEIITIEMPPARYSPWAQKNLVMKRVTRR
ncbi:MAG: OadG family protein [Lentimicrobiaceae bacterium]|nr:OadG family protein [Lentimicrobiaceae bacterium]